MEFMQRGIRKNLHVSSAGPKRQRSLKAIPILALLCATVVIGRAFVVMHAKLKLSALDVLQTKHEKCEEQCRPSGTEALPKGIVSSISDFELRPLWGSPVEKKLDMNLLAMAVGKKQKANVDRTVRKFLNNDFTVVLFHYDGNVDDWKDLEWSAQTLHIAAGIQTKWWFAKRFLHPDIVAKYSYIFLWDEDLGVENFNVQSYLSVVKKEGLEISQPAIDPHKSKECHHQLTMRQDGTLVHRRYHGPIGRIKCDENSVDPPCTGLSPVSMVHRELNKSTSCRWVEMMAPVFSRAAWRCTWYMIQVQS
ncbi:hypothetical protein Cgig2_012797 [Carnegiea gigantea]|uniref:Uncharacterized protein n=1 Tax=Carnegiea gigantea TaxID=171969 RepID=A0A9Q1KCI1_9CARY|nr:hypothetical protein Cgig2_012797 [Carnegiea gigantea]